MDYPLVKLIEWTRRHGGDLAKRATSSGVSDGTQRYTIADEGSITVDRVDLAFVTLPDNQWTAEQGIINLVGITPDAGDDVLVAYFITRYSDAEVLAFLTDAARGVAGDMLLEWEVDETDPSNPVVQAGEAELEGRARRRIEQLIVYRAGLYLYAAKTNQSADDAIKIRDDDTSIDTSVTAGASEKALTRMTNVYRQALLTARSEGFFGSASSEQE